MVKLYYCECLNVVESSLTETPFFSIDGGWHSLLITIPDRIIIFLFEVIKINWPLKGFIGGSLKPFKVHFLAKILGIYSTQYAKEIFM